MRRRALFLPLAAAFLGALLAACAPRQPYDLDAGRIRADTEYQCDVIGIRPAGSPKERETCDWLQSRLEELGFSFEAGTLDRASFSGLQGQDSENLVAVCNPDPTAPLVSVVAHYDSVETSPGAGDNAASVAILLEIARYLGPAHPDFPCEIRMVFLGSEENGYHGSAAYVSSLSREDRDRHLGAYNMDISAACAGDGAVLVCTTLGGLRDGTYTPGDYFSPQDNLVSSSVAGAYRALFGEEMGGVFHTGESDHVSFHNAGLDAANICWRRVENGLLRLPDCYHRMSDTPDILDYETARTTGRCILQAIHTAASAA